MNDRNSLIYIAAIIVVVIVIMRLPKKEMIITCANIWRDEALNSLGEEYCPPTTTTRLPATRS